MANNLAQYTQLVNAAAMDKVFNKTLVLADFTTRFTDEAIGKHRSTVKVPLLSGSAVQTNPTNFTGGTNGSTMISVDTNFYSIPFEVTAADFTNGYRLADLVATNVQVLVEKIQEVAFAPLATTNFAVGLSAADSAMSLANLQTLWASLVGSKKMAYLNSVAYSKLLTNQNTQIDPSVGGPYSGFSRLAYTDVFTGAGTGVWGFAANPKGLVMASGIPSYDSAVNDLLDTSIIDLGNGMSASLNIWADANTRTSYGSVDIAFGVAVGDPAGIKLAKV